MYPPYSICYFDALVLKGTLDRQLQAEQTATELLLACPNVKLYNFFDQYDIICNTDYYCDDGHYNGEVNSMLLQMMAQVTGLKAGDFIHTTGDTHLYLNHIEQAKLQLTREPRPLPTMKINPDVKSIFDFQFEDFELVGYDPHPHIKAEVSV